MVFVIAEEGDNIYERYDKNGNFTHYRIAKRVKCIDGTTKYIVAQSKTSERGCKYRLSRKLKEFYAEQEEERRKLPSPDMRFKYFATNWYETNIKYSNTTQSNKNEYKSIVFKKLIPWFGEMSLCEITEDELKQAEKSNEAVEVISNLQSELQETKERLASLKSVTANLTPRIKSLENELECLRETNMSQQEVSALIEGLKNDTIHSTRAEAIYAVSNRESSTYISDPALRSEAISEIEQTIQRMESSDTIMSYIEEAYRKLIYGEDTKKIDGPLGEINGLLS